mmetsp:Transcript_3110/g.4782  ORF Transcript_3110/g.4782 Transcript_3110/m.4782 type:complete len:82 (+) Transcript_3110:124-369(+)
MEIVVTDRQDQILSLKVRGGDEKVLAVKEKVRDSCNIRMDQIKLKFKRYDSAGQRAFLSGEEFCRNRPRASWERKSYGGCV